MKHSKSKLYRTIFVFVALVMALAFAAIAQNTQAAQVKAQANYRYQSTVVVTPEPTDEPTAEPTGEPTDEPTAEPTDEPTAEPTDEPTAEPTDEPTAEPTDEPTAEPTDEPTAEPTAEPTTEPTAEPTAEPTGFTIEVEGPALVTVGDVFTVSVVAKNIPDPGIFGYQFKLAWDDAAVTPAGSPILSADFSVVAKAALNANSYELAVSREGDVADLGGNLTLLTIPIEALTVTDPNATTFSLSLVKVGRKGGIAVPVDNLIDLDVVIVEDNGGDTGNIAGVVTVQGRAADNQAGHSVSDGAVLTTTTAADGSFTLADAAFGTYDLTANSAGFLAAACTNLSHTENVTNLTAVTLLAGDLDDSGNIDITDAVAIGLVFGSTAADEVADLNNDGEVDVLDLILMAANFGQTSTANPWVCQ